MDEFCIIYVTTPDKQEAVKIARSLLRKKLAAGINIYDGITSVYRWEGKEQHHSEAALFIKTRKSLFSKIKDDVKNMHSYSCPAIISLPVEQIEQNFAQWIKNNTE